MAARDDSKDFYKVKRISFFGRKDVPIICQNENGPCPLLAIANVLLLRNAIALEGSPDRPEVSTAELLSLLAARLLDVNDKSTSRDEMVRQNQEQNLNDAMAVLPALATGLDVNVRFRHPLDFEFTAELAVFDLLDVTLCHAWVAGPEHAAARDAVGARSYNQLMERLVELATAEEASSTAEEASSSAEARRPTHETEDASEEDAALRAALALSLDDDAGTKTPETPTSPTSRAVSAALGEIVAEVSAEASDDAGTSRVFSQDSRAEDDADAVRDARRHERIVIDAFLESSASQLTRDGLRDARDAVKERELAVFFRNNHFATVFKLDGALYLLVTDQGYLREPDVVWETLCEAEAPKTSHAAREGAFVDAAFAPFAPHDGLDPAARRSDENDARLAAALLASAAETSDRRGREDADAIPATFLRAGGAERRAPSDGEALLASAETRAAGASADADHALAVALQAEYEEERAREEAAARARRAEAVAATRAPPPPPLPPRRRPGAGASSSRRGALPPRSKKSSYSSDCVVM